MTAKTLIRFNMGMTILWICLVIPTLLWWRTSILWVAFMSLYANIVGHWSALIAGKAQQASETNP